MAFKKITLFAAILLSASQLWAQCLDPFSVTVLTSPVCTGRDFQLIATDYPGAVYNWTGPAGSGFAGVYPYNPTISGTTLANNGVYFVTVTLPGGCIYNANVNVTVEVTPPKPTVVVNTSPTCPNTTVNMLANSGSPIGSTYFWSGPNWPGFNSNVVNTAAINNIQPNNTGNYTVYVETTAGCKSDATVFDITVHPEVKASFAQQTFLGCDKDSVKFTNTSTGAFSNDWDFGDGTGSGLADPLHTYTTQGSYTIRLIASNQFCKDTTQQQITFNHTVDANFTVDDDSICQDNLINFTNATTYTPAILPTYAWNFKDGGTGTTIDIAHNYTLAGTYKAVLVATDYLGCKDSAEHIIIVDSAGSISFTPSEVEVCAGETIEFKGTFMQIGNTGTTWTMGDGNILTNKPYINYTFDAAGTYDVKFIATYRICPNAEFTESIKIKPYPKVNIGDDTSICLNSQPLILRDMINEGNPNAKWMWNNAGYDAHKSAIEVRHSGVYAATVEIDGCEATDSVIVKNNCFINIPNAFSPNNDGNGDYFLPRQMLANGISKFNMSIYNRWGQLLFTTNNLNGRGWDGRYNNEPQPLGVYVYLIDVTFIDGSRENYQGNLTLLR
jgi:gliding motility-associated-like protein